MDAAEFPAPAILGKDGDRLGADQSAFDFLRKVAAQVLEGAA